MERLAHQALALDAWKRPEFLDAACAQQPDLRTAVNARVEDLSHENEQTTTPGARMIGRYEVRQQLGRGGMGVVYLAWDTKLRRFVALKALPADVAADEDSRRRLIREAQSAAAIADTTYIATVYDIIDERGDLHLVGEYVMGETLRARLRGGPLPLDEAIERALQLASGLAAAHAHRVVHRDLKPENLMISTTGHLKILDFGLARREGIDSARFTMSGSVAGTPAYMSPEQAEGLPTDFRTDLFAFGLIAFEMVTGRNPMEGPTFSDTFRMRLVNFDPPSLAAAFPGCPTELDWIVSTCLRRDRTQRFASTTDLVNALGELDARRKGRPTPTPLTPVPMARLPRPPDAAARWWKTHLAIVSLVYAGMIYPAWHVRSWMPSDLGMPLLLVDLAAAAGAVAMRLHLWFTHDVDLDELAALYARTSRWILVCDVAFTVVLVATAAGIGGQHPEFAMLFILAAVLMAVAAWVIEPTTVKRVLKSSGLMPRDGGHSSH